MKISNKQRGLAVLLAVKDEVNRRNEGITSSCDFLIDYERALSDADLTVAERYILHAKYSGERPEPIQTQLASELGVHRSSISRYTYTAIEKLGCSVEKTHGEDYDYLAKERLIFDVIALEDSYVSIEEVKRIKAQISGEIPEGFCALTVAHSTVTKYTNLLTNQRKFDGTVTLVNMASGDDYHDGIYGLIDGRYEYLEGGEIEHLDRVIEVDYTIKKGDVIAKAEVIV